VISVFAVCGVDDVPIGNREPLLSDGPVSVRFVVSLLKLLVAAESKYDSFSFIAFATAVLSSVAVSSACAVVPIYDYTCCPVCAGQTLV
jgi:hypothetical protein